LQRPRCRIGELLMQCENCHANLLSTATVCRECRTIVRYNVRGFDNTKKVQRLLKVMINEQADRIRDEDSLISIIYDYLPECETERRILKKMINGGVLEDLVATQDPKAQFAFERKRMVRELGATKNEAEFTLASLGYMLGYPYPSPLRVIQDPASLAAEAKKDPSLLIDHKIFRKLDAFKFRLSRAISVKEGYTKLDGYCFDGFGIARTISMPKTLRVIGEYAFSDCKHIEEMTIPSGVKKIEKGAFNACVGLKKLKLPKDLIDIGDNTFFCCTSLETLKIPEKVSSIGENAFSGCGNLKTLVIAQQVKFVDDNAFAYCPNLTIVCYENSYIHKYCLQNRIKFKTLAAGTALPDV